MRRIQNETVIRKVAALVRSGTQAHVERELLTMSAKGVKTGITGGKGVALQVLDRVPITAGLT